MSYRAASSRLPLALLLVLALGLGLVLAQPAPAAAATQRWERQVTDHFARGAVTVADITGDGVNDLVVGNLDGRVHAYDAVGNPLPGFPAPVVINGTQTAVESTPAVADLDGDGAVEIIVGAGSIDRRDQHGGVVVLDRSGRKRCEFRTRDTFNQWEPGAGPDGFSDGVFGSVAVGDVTGDGAPNLVFGSWDHHVYVLDAACGKLGDYNNADTIWSSPALHNIDGDGGLDVFIGADASDNPEVPWARWGGRVRRLSWDQARGQLSQAWVRMTDASMFSSPVLADITGNGRLELVIGAGPFYDTEDARKVFVFDAETGNDIASWPRDTGGVTRGTPAVGDLTGDGVPEVVIGNGAGAVLAYTHGQTDPLWSVRPGREEQDRRDEVVGAPVIADLNGDGRNDVVIGKGAGAYFLDGRNGSLIHGSYGFAEHSASAVAQMGASWAVVSTGFNPGPNRTIGTGHVRVTDIPTPGVTPPWPQFQRSAANVGAPDSAAVGVGSTRLLRISGSDRIDTAVQISGRSYGVGQAQTVVLARAGDYPDALAGTPLAVHLEAPLMLTHSDRLDPRVRTEIERVLPRGHAVYLLGGTAALSPAIEREIESMGYGVARFGGRNRFETAVTIAKHGLPQPRTALLATGLNFPDALSAGAAAPAAGGAVLLTAGNRMPAETAAYLAEHRPDRVYAIGGAARDAARAAGLQAHELAGRDRFVTAIKVAQEFAPTPGAVALANGGNFPDALGGGAHASRRGAPLILSPTGGMTPDVDLYLQSVRDHVGHAFVYGGSGAVSDTVLQQARNALG